MESEFSDSSAHGAVAPITSRRTPQIEICATDLKKLEDLRELGNALAAWQVAQTIGPLGRWTGTRSRVAGGWLAHSLGAPKLARVMGVLGWRGDKTDAEACACHAHDLLHGRGPLAAWEFLNRVVAPVAHRPEAQVYLLTVRALVTGYFRDFETAGKWLARAEEIAADKPWLAVTRAYVLEQEDRYEEALASARTSLTLRPNCRAGFHAVAHCLRLLNRDEEAEATLAQGADALEHGSLLCELARLQIELGKIEAAFATLERFVAASPLMEKGVADWVKSQRLLIACRGRDWDSARSLAQEFKDPYHDGLCRRLEQAGIASRRVQLKVSFVRQHHATCAPATLAALTGFWGKPCQHAELAEAVCYDGTPSHSERSWSATHGWIAREFTITWAAAVALLERGVPFTLTTSEATSGHLQAVVGCDELRGTFIIRDPFRYSEMEFPVEPLLERYRATGPRGMALVPTERGDLLEGLELPDADLYDCFNEVLAALERHDRTSAGTALRGMESQAPEHRLTLSAQRALAAYDANTPALLKAVERLLEKYPNDGNLLLTRLGCLRELGRRAERLELLERVCADKACEPVLIAHYAQELRADAREHRNAEFFCRRALRRQPLEAGNLATRADLLWEQRRFSEALEYYRLAACLEDKKENFARSYFIAARHLRETERVLGVLRSRFERFGQRSAMPVITLFEGLEQLERTPEAFVVLGRALVLRPDDGALILFAAEANARHARTEECAKWLERAQGFCRRATWLRTAARLANARNDRVIALAHWRELVGFEPTACDAHRQIALLLAETEGREAALKHLRQVSEQFPYNFALGQLRLEWLRDEDAKEWERAARELLAIHPSDAWVKRELALALGRQSRWTEALIATDEAVLMEPGNTVSFSVRGTLRRDAGQHDAAVMDFRKAIELSVDNAGAIDFLLPLLSTLDEKREALRFIQHELERQVVFGESLLVFRERARGLFSAEELTKCLQAALDARPDLWHAWSAMINHAVERRDLETAEGLAREATERFPLLPRLWLDRARVLRALSNSTGERAALEQALAVNPDWSIAARQLASAHARSGDFERARNVMERACARNPLDAENHAELAKALWSLQRREEATRELKAGIELNPGFEWFWTLLAEWARELNQSDLSLQIAQELTARRGGEARSWIILARMTHGREELNKVLATLDCALERSPRSAWAYDVRAEILAFAGQKEAALKACYGKVWDGHPPLELQSRAAWIEARFGHMDVAITQMQKLLKDHPDYYAGWKTLADWLWGAGHENAALAATDHMAELTPFDPIPLGYRAAMKIRKRDRDGAKADLQRALALAPDYEFAANNLFDILLEEKDLDGAERVLDVMRQHQNRDNAIACQLKLQARKAQTHTGTQTVPAAAKAAVGSKPPTLPASTTWLTGEKLKVAIESFRSLCVSKGENGAPLEQACQTLVAARVAGEVDEVLNEMVERTDANPQVGALWVRRRAAHKEWGLRDKLVVLRERGEIGRRAIITYVSCLGDAGRGPALLNLLEEQGEWLARDTWGWEAATVALGATKQWSRLVDWAGDWHSQLNAHPAALHYVLIALQARRRYCEAAELARAASKLGRPGRGFEALLAWAALEHANAGELETAKAALAKIDREALSDYSHRIQRMARAVMAIRSATREERSQAWKEARGLIARAIQGIAILKSDRAFRRAFLRSNFCMARVGGRPWHAFWAASRVYGPLMAAIPLILILVAVVAGGVAAGAVSPALFVVLFLIIRAASRRD